jgi:hypothetical protein
MPVSEGTGLGTPLQATAVPGAGTSEVQTLTIGGTPTGGTFRLVFAGFTTAPITWSNVNATLLAAIQSALQALPTIGGGNATTAAGTLTAGIGTVLISFAGTLANRAVPTITVAENLMTGTTPTAAVAETTPGVDAAGLGAPRGARLINLSTGVMYINTGSATSPTWIVVGTQT